MPTNGSHTPSGHHYPPPAEVRVDDDLLRRLGKLKLRELQRRGVSPREIAELARQVETAQSPSLSARGPLERFSGTGSAGDALDQLTLDQQFFLRTLDALRDGMLLFDIEHRLLHANTAAVRILDGDPEPELLRAEIRRLVSVVCTKLAGTHSHAEVAFPVTTGAQSATTLRLRMRGSYIGLDLLGQGAVVLITLERVALESIPDDVLRKRFGLTKAEIRVAQLLAEGRTNSQIAAALFISQHTARHHTGNVLRKLGARSRAEVGARLRQEK
jgi:DNA-binding CsgD family transcriptional regulator